MQQRYTTWKPRVDRENEKKAEEARKKAEAESAAAVGTEDAGPVVPGEEHENSEAESEDSLDLYIGKGKGKATGDDGKNDEWTWEEDLKLQSAIKAKLRQYEIVEDYFPDRSRINISNRVAVLKDRGVDLEVIGKGRNTEFLNIYQTLWLRAQKDGENEEKEAEVVEEDGGIRLGWSGRKAGL